MTEENKVFSSHNHTGVAYIVEYKNDDGIWKRLPIQEVPEGCGVPAHQVRNEFYDAAGVFSLEAAMALVYQAKAKKISWRKQSTEFMFREMRIVECKFEYSYSASRTNNVYEIPRKLDFSKQVNHKGD